MVIYSGFSYKMVSFYSFLYVYQRVTMKHWDLNGIVGFCPSTGDFATFEYRRWWIFHRIFHLFVISLEVTTGFLIIAKIDGFPYLLLDAGFSW